MNKIQEQKLRKYIQIEIENMLNENYGTELQKAVRIIHDILNNMKGTDVETIGEIWLDLGQKLGLISEMSADKIKNLMDTH